MSLDGWSNPRLSAISCNSVLCSDAGLPSAVDFANSMSFSNASAGGFSLSRILVIILDASDAATLASLSFFVFIAASRLVISVINASISPPIRPVAAYFPTTRSGLWILFNTLTNSTALRLGSCSFLCRKSAINVLITNLAASVFGVGEELQKPESCAPFINSTALATLIPDSATVLVI